MISPSSATIRGESECVGQDSTASGDEFSRFPLLRSHPDLAEAIAAVVVPVKTRLQTPTWRPWTSPGSGGTPSVLAEPSQNPRRYRVLIPDPDHLAGTAESRVRRDKMGRLTLLCEGEEETVVYVM